MLRGMFLDNGMNVVATLIYLHKLVIIVLLLVKSYITSIFYKSGFYHNI